ncbi:MAG: hypothetical protein HYX26_06250 [Acidobacteriales bacterium]|nr:hypothetical protein [Terriglobales bacterium]
MRNLGIGLIILAYLLLFHTALRTAVHGRAHPHPEVTVSAEPDAPWEAAVTGALAAAGIMLAAMPVRRGDKWAWWTSATMLAILLVTRVATDPRCWVVYDPHQHGCHTFMIAMVMGIAGLAMARR